jgi:hypothetical protein
MTRNEALNEAFLTAGQILNISPAATTVNLAADQGADAAAAR